MAKNDNLTDFLTDVANAIREKKGTTDLINPQDFSAEIASIETGGGEGGGYEPKPEYFMPLYIEALESITIAFANQYEYSNDNKTWQSGTSETSISANSGEKVYFRASGLTATSSAGIGKFTISGQCNVGGNAMSMLYGADYVGKYTLEQNHCFMRLFGSNSQIISAKKLSLPATTLTKNCYQVMFYNCTSLVDAPALPAVSLSDYCYGSMFYGCSSLIKAPALPAVTIANYCYSSMFSGCSSLVDAPALPATELGFQCYGSMFNECSSLIEAPILPATILSQYCYWKMFSNCSKLQRITMLSISNGLSYTYTNEWVKGVPGNGVFVKNIDATWEESTGDSAIPYSWVVESTKL